MTESLGDDHDGPAVPDSAPPVRHRRQRANPADAAGTLSGVFPPGYLEELRDEWDDRHDDRDDESAEAGG